MVAPFTDLRDGDAENLIYLVLSGFITRPTLPASLLISAYANEDTHVDNVTEITQFERNGERAESLA